MAPIRTQPSDLQTAGRCRMTSPLQQKIKITGPSMATENPTSDGVLSYRTASSGWTTDRAEAAIVRNADDAWALRAESVADDVGAIGGYIAPVEIGDGGKVKPGNLREHIRSKG